MTEYLGEIHQDDMSHKPTKEGENLKRTRKKQGRKKKRKQKIRQTDRQDRQTERKSFDCNNVGWLIHYFRCVWSREILFNHFWLLINNHLETYWKYQADSENSRCCCPMMTCDKGFLLNAIIAIHHPIGNLLYPWINDKLSSCCCSSITTIRTSKGQLAGR